MTIASRNRHLQRNRMLPCQVNPCTKLRSRGARFCAAHSKRMKLHGHPQGRALQDRELRGYRQQARAFLARYPDSPQVIAATEFLNGLLSLGSVERGASDAERQLHRIVQYGMTGAEALEIVLGVWFYSDAERGALPDDKRLTYALATALFKGRPVSCHVTLLPDGSRTRRYFTPPGLARKEVGEAIRSRLSIFFANAIAALREEERKRREEVARIANPFVVADFPNVATAPTPSTPTNESPNQ